MCVFKSAIVLKTGEILHNDFFDSHERLIALYKLKDDKIDSDFCRVEFIPVNNAYLDVNAYRFRIDQEKPSWWDNKIESETIGKLKRIIKRYFLTSDTYFLPPGCYIADGSPRVFFGYGCRIISGGSMQVKYGGSMQVECGDSMQVKYGDSMWVVNK